MKPKLDIGQSALIADLAMCINHYRLFSPGLYCCVHAPVELVEGDRLNPSVIAQVNHGRLKQCDPGEKYDCFRGAPNFVLDVFADGDTASYEKLRVLYEQHQAKEYLAVWQSDPLTWTWNRLTDGRFVEIDSDHDDLIMSAALPGLWIRTNDLCRRDWWAVMATIERGVSRREHHAFMDTIWNGD